jgi:hypothetical protein
MVLTREELIASLQNEVRILLHLAGKIDRTQLDYRPTPEQRSTIELLQYLSVMGPTVIPFIQTGVFDGATWQAALAAARGTNFDQVLAAIEKQRSGYAELLHGWSEDEFRGEIEMLGRKASRGYIIVSLVLCPHAAYRTQLFLYLKACGRGELNTMNLWAGVDAPKSG